MCQLSSISLSFSHFLILLSFLTNLKSIQKKKLYNRSLVQRELSAYEAITYSNSNSNSHSISIQSRSHFTVFLYTTILRPSSPPRTHPPLQMSTPNSKESKTRQETIYSLRIWARLLTKTWSITSSCHPTTLLTRNRLHADRDRDESPASID